MRTDTKLRREAEALTLTDRATMDGLFAPNARMQSPNGQRTFEVNATPEALLLWQRAGWIVSWLKDSQ